jgi:hypothetical protein
MTTAPLPLEPIAKPKKAAAKTDYIILSGAPGSPSSTPLDWRTEATRSSSSADNAIRKYADEQGDKVAGKTLVAVPARSWNPRLIKVETTQKITLG